MNPFEKIKLLRSKLELSQDEFAAKLGIHQRDLSKMERGDKKFLPNEVITQIMRMGYDVNTLFNDELPLSKMGEEIISAQEPVKKYQIGEKKHIIPEERHPLLDEFIVHFTEKKEKGDSLDGDDMMNYIVEWFSSSREESETEVRFLRLESIVSKMRLEMLDIKDMAKAFKKS